MLTEHIVAQAMHMQCGWSLATAIFLYVPAVSNTVTTGNSKGTKNVLKWNRALWFVLSIQYSVYRATAVLKVSLFSTWTRSTVNFTLCKRRNLPV